MSAMAMLRQQSETVPRGLFHRTARKSKVIATVAARSSSCNDNPTTNCLGLLPMKVDSDPALEV